MSHPEFPRAGLLFSLLLHFLNLLLLFTSASRCAAMGIIMPVYGNTSSQFTAAETAARRVPLIAIFNPDDGPGFSKNSSYASSVNRIKSAGGQVVGYIATGYTKVAIAGVKAQMDKYSSWYGVNGYFLDEMSNTSSQLSYYKSANDYAGGKGKFVVGNPGTGTLSSYLNVARILITFENPVGSGWSGASSAGDPSRYGAIPYSAGSLSDIITQASRKGYGWIYVTNLGEPDPFGRLPSFWEQELQAVETLNIPPLPAALPAGQFFITTLQSPTGGGVSITFPAVARRRYGIQVSAHLQSWTPAYTPDAVPVPSEITPTANGLVTLRAALVSGSRSAFYRAVDLDTLAGK